MSLIGAAGFRFDRWDRHQCASANHVGCLQKATLWLDRGLSVDPEAWKRSQVTESDTSGFSFPSAAELVQTLHSERGARCSRVWFGPGPRQPFGLTDLLVPPQARAEDSWLIDQGIGAQCWVELIPLEPHQTFESVAIPGSFAAQGATSQKQNSLAP